MIKKILKISQRFFFIGIISSLLIFICLSIFNTEIKIDYKIINFFIIIFFLYLGKTIIFLQEDKKTKFAGLIKYFLIISFIFLLKDIGQIYLINKIVFSLSLISIFFLKFNSKDKGLSKFVEKILIIFIIITFTIIKVPHFYKNFTGNNTMKYNTYVEPAKHMVENNDYFKFYRKYRANPINNIEGKDRLTTLPVIEWSLALLYRTFGLNNLIPATRMYMHFIAILILIFSYILIKKLINGTTAIIFIALLIQLPLFSLISHLTVYDSLLMLFFIIAYYFYESFKNGKSYKKLAIAGVFLGLANLMKNSVIMWALPTIVFNSFLTNKKELKNFFKEIIILLLFTGLTSMFYLLSIKPIDSNPNIFIICSLISIFLVVFLIKKVNWIKKVIENILNYLSKRKYLSYLSLLAILINGLYIFIRLASNWSEFFTDKDIIFHFPMYQKIFELRQMEFINPLIFSFTLLGLITVLSKKIKTKEKNTVCAFFFGAMFYLFVNSKVIYFHNYYSIHIIYVYLMLAALFISKLLENSKTIFKIIFIIILWRSSFELNQRQFSELMNKEKHGFEEVVTYLENHSEKDEFYLDDSHTLSLSIFTNNPCISNLNYPQIQKSIKQIGFYETMKKYKIKYLITNMNEPNYQHYALPFTDLDLAKHNYGKIKRTDLILNRFNTPQEVLDKSEEIKKNDYFKLERIIGSYKIYNLYGEL